MTSVLYIKVDERITRKRNENKNKMTTMFKSKIYLLCHFIIGTTNDSYSTSPLKSIVIAWNI